MHEATAPPTAKTWHLQYFGQVCTFKDIADNRNKHIANPKKEDHQPLGKNT